MAAVPMQDPPAAAEEMRRALTELGLVGVITPGVIYEQTLDQPQFQPFFAEADRLGASVALHAVTGAYPTVGQELFSTFFGTHMVAMPFNLMAGMVALIGGGIIERYPRVRWAFMETGCGWVPYWAERLDEHWERLYEPKLKAGEAVAATRSPSETLRSGRCFFACEPEERTLPAVIDLIGVDTLMISSDYPHGDSKWPYSVRTVRERTDISEEAKRKILGDNAARFYPLGVPAAT
jgi:predicted TIM-barrel fold metal-dependent hydrolase